MDRKKGKIWIWKVRNRELKFVGPLRLRIENAQSLDAELNKLREPCNFKCDLGLDKRIDSGEFGKQHIFARLEGDALEIGDRRLTRLPWPSGDMSQVQRWLLTLELSGYFPAYKPGVNWSINLSMIWNPASTTLEFSGYSSGLIIHAS